MSLMIPQPTIEAANLGMADSLILLVLALVVFGPRRLPTIGRQIGKLMFEFRKASNDFRFQMDEELRSSEEAERKQKAEQARLANPEPTPADEAAGTPSPYAGEDVYPEQSSSAEIDIPEYRHDAEPVAEPVAETTTEPAAEPAPAESAVAETAETPHTTPAESTEAHG